MMGTFGSVEPECDLTNVLTLSLSILIRSESVLSRVSN